MTLAGLGAALLFSACSPSLHPFFNESNVVFRDTLLGIWIGPSGDRLTFTKSGNDHYELLYVDETSARFEARLFELGGATFLDLYPQIGDKGNSLYLTSLVRAHALVKLTIGEDSLSIALLDDEWLKKLSDQRQLGLAHERLADGTIVLTAPTSELQAFILRDANREEAFGESETFRRLSDK
jgi:hypothetical protein